MKKIAKSAKPNYVVQAAESQHLNIPNGSDAPGSVAASGNRDGRFNGASAVNSSIDRNSTESPARAHHDSEVAGLDDSIHNQKERLRRPSPAKSRTATNHDSHGATVGRKAAEREPCKRCIENATKRRDNQLKQKKSLK